MRFLCAALCAALLLACPCRADGLPATSAASAILVDAESGRVLYEKDAHTRRGIASTTKLMTALVAAESVADLSARVEILREDTLTEGSSMYLKVGETVTVEALFYGLLLQSGNDAALALARYCAGDVETFVARMNEKARALGMADTRFANPNGLDDEDHYSTAADMAVLAAACMDNELVAKVAACKTAVVDGRTFVNHNKLLSLYPDCVGMKTGYTSASGRTLVSAARRDGQLLLCVTLGDPDDWRDHAALFDYGFETYPRQLLSSANRTVGLVRTTGSLVPVVPVRTAGETWYPLAAEEQVKAGLELPDRVQAPSPLPWAARPSGRRRWCAPPGSALTWRRSAARWSGSGPYSPGRHRPPLPIFKRERCPSWRNACKSCSPPPGSAPGARRRTTSRPDGSPSTARPPSWATRPT